MSGTVKNLKAFDIKVAFQFADMSGGDSVDGPRWTGGYIQRENSFLVIAPSAAMAKAAIMASFYIGQHKPKVLKCSTGRRVDAIATIQLHSSHDDAPGNDDDD